MELRDRVDQISATIDELREAAGDGPRTRRLVDSLFRTVHTFKAAASAEGLNDLSRTAHEFENLLHLLRTGKLTLDDDVFSALDETAAALAGKSLSSPLPSLEQHTTDQNSAAHELPVQFAALKEEERHRAIAAIREGANLYVMNVEFATADFDERFRHLKEQLERTAEVISTSAKLENDKIFFQVVYASEFEKIPVQTAVRQAIRAGQATANVLGKKIEFAVKGEELLLERSVTEALTDALLHLVRNAVDHGIETQGSILIEVLADQVSVTDNGRGIDPANLPLLFQPGFSTANDVTEVSGRGVGLAVVKTAVEEIGGNVSVTSEPGKGSSFQIKIPNPSKMPNPSSDA